MKNLVLSVFILAMAFPVRAANKDFKGLFGSYQREKFTENEARDSDWGVDLSLSSMLPITSVVNSITTTGGAASPMRYSTFFNIEGSLLFSLAYHWQLYASTGYFSYDTRKETTNNVGTEALFHMFDLTAIPVVFGVRHRFSVQDLVPYLGIGAGIARVTRRGSYDIANSAANEQIDNVLTGQIQAGLEFYFSSRAGLRLELSGNFLKTSEFNFDSAFSGSTTLPDIIYQPNVFSLRYSSGLFYLF